MFAAAAVWLVYSGVEVVGDGACPDPAEVSRRLAQIAPTDDAGAARGHRARLSRGASALHVELLDASGARLGARDLSGNESCDDLALAAAIVVAAWEAELDPRVAARVTLPRPPGPAAPSALAVAAAAPPPRAAGPGFDLGLALIASVAGGDVAPGARIEAWIAPPGRRVGLGMALSGATARSAAVGAHADAARWTRIALGAGPDGRFEIGRTMVAAHVHLLACALHVEGVGLTAAASDYSAQAGIGTGLRVGRPWGNATPWIGTDVLYWGGHDQLQIEGLADRGELPHLEVQIAVGLSLGRFP